VKLLLALLFAAPLASPDAVVKAPGRADAGLVDAGLPQPAPPRQKPAPALGELRPLLGSWECKGKQRLAPGSAELPTRSTWTFAQELDGFWVSVALTQLQTPQNPHPVKALGHLGYDDEQDRFVAGLALNDGSSEQLGSPGWEGDQLILSGQYRQGDDRLNFRRIFERSGGGLQISLELQLIAPDWTKVSDESCAHP